MSIKAGEHILLKKYSKGAFNFKSIFRNLILTIL